MTLSYLWLRQCALHRGCSKYWQQCLVNIQAGPLLPHSGQQECVWHLPWSERGSRPAPHPDTAAYKRGKPLLQSTSLPSPLGSCHADWPHAWLMCLLCIHFSTCIQPFCQIPATRRTFNNWHRPVEWTGQPRWGHICVWSGLLLPALSLTIMSF